MAWTGPSTCRGGKLSLPSPSPQESGSGLHCLCSHLQHRTAHRLSEGAGSTSAHGGACEQPDLLWLPGKPYMRNECALPAARFSFSTTLLTESGSQQGAADPAYAAPCCSSSGFPAGSSPLPRSLPQMKGHRPGVSAQWFLYCPAGEVTGFGQHT